MCRDAQVWVLDALPGEVRAGEAERKDHPADLIETLRRIVLPLRSRATLQEQLLQAGFSAHIARWTTTNLRAINGDPTCAPQWNLFLVSMLQFQLCCGVLVKSQRIAPCARVV